MATFDCLTTELLLEIFDYLSFTDIFRAFFNLQQRINDVIQTYPVCIDLTKTTDQNALVYGPFLCRALIIACDDSLENEINALPLNFGVIRALEFKYGNSTMLLSIFDQLPISQLESITIGNFDNENSSVNIGQQIWSTIAIAGQNKLRYLRASLPIIREDTEQLLFDLPSLKCAILNHVSAEEVLRFILHTPNLCSLTSSVAVWNIHNYEPSFTLSNFRHLDLRIKGCNSFERLGQIFSVCPYLTHLILRFWITESNVFMVDGTQWQTLVEQYLPCLTYLKVRLFRYERLMDDPNFDDTFNLSEYWFRRKPEFDIKVW
ncbi:unnamed protein product [Rotaria socialis]|uniref:F-box domain-containing protein n=1 Tax=Rotaria socialis TaxID=392032 RepID=A0A818DG82_9BILA|nr:unnamed protein product [Rotaria socialis]CAF3421316.1 unnamed protein product [Rotaria socialis]CAF3434734.1 unnamed protein product [Rotaria socialis]CAF4327165.1 unnamed protein product [Rotaria socialis]CAF4363451.1 unnamed protein product [Rotaria socialis]